MERMLEPELMDDEGQARAYAEADFEAPNSQFVDLFAEYFGDFSGNGYLLDLGCGPGDICLRLARRYPQAIVHGLDGAPAMLAHARQALARLPDLQGRVEFLQGVLPEAVLPLGNYQAIVSNSLLHHLHDPLVLWHSVRHYAVPGAPVLAMDLLRPPSQQAARQIVDSYAAGEPPILRRDFFNSLLAAFSLEEVRAQLLAAGLEDFTVVRVSDRHLAVYGRNPSSQY